MTVTGAETRFPGASLAMAGAALLAAVLLACGPGSPPHRLGKSPKARSPS